MDKMALAQQVGETMFANDRATRETVGMDLVSCQPGRASMRMVVQEKQPQPQCGGSRLQH